MQGKRIVWSTFVACGLASGTSLHAQTASQITPRTFAPPRAVTPAAPLSLPADTMRTPPPGADALFVTLAAVAPTGGTLAPDTVAALQSRLVGKRVSVADIFAAAGEAEATEARRGRVLLRVTVPQQDLRDGATLRLAVIEGFVERVDASGMPSRVRGVVEAMARRLVGARDVTLADLDRRLTLVGDIPGLAITTTLSPGTQPGGVVLSIAGTHRPITGFVSVDNTLPDSLGRTAVGVGIDLNSVAGGGELIYLRASGLPSGGSTGFFDRTPRNRAVAAGLVVPLTDNGLKLALEGTDARTAPRRGSPLLPAFASRFERLSVSLRYPLVRRRGASVGVEARFDAQRERVRIIDPLTLPLSEDRLRIARLSGDATVALPGGGFAGAEVEGSLGLDILSARSAADATPLLPLSRAGSGASFGKLAVSGTIEHPLGRLGLAAVAHAQTSFGKPLGNSEQFGAARADAISPLPTGSLQGDAGYSVRGELRAPIAFGTGSVRAGFTPYVFVANAGVRFEQPTALERRSTQAFAYGGGIRLAGSATDGSPGITAGAEYGRVHLPGSHPDRFSFVIVARF